jgi:hypothetical protein
MRSGNWTSGVYINPTRSRPTITGNYIHHNTAGIGGDSYSNATIVGNTITANAEGIGISNDDQNYVVLNNNVNYNNISGNTGGIRNYCNGYVLNAENNWWGDPSGPDA